MKIYLCRKASNIVPVFIVFNIFQQSKMEAVKGDTNHNACFVVCCLWVEKWNETNSPEMQQMTCRRIGMEEERVSLWAALANGNRANKVHFNGAIMHLGIWLGEYSSSAVS